MQSQLTEKQKQDTYKLMEILAIEPEQANALMVRSNFHLETAINMHMNPLPSFLLPDPPSLASVIGIPDDLDLPPPTQHPQSSLPKPNRRHQFHNVNQERAIQVYKKTYLIKKKEKIPIKKKSHQKRNKGNVENGQEEGKMSQEYSFRGELEKLLKDRSYIEFHEDLFNVFDQMLTTKKLVALHCLSLAGQNEHTQEDRTEGIKQLYSKKQFIQNVNKAFLNYGLEPTRFDFGHYPFMKDFVDAHQDQSTLILLRLNEITYKVELFQKLPILSTFKLENPEGFKQIVANLRRQSNLMALNSPTEVRTLTQTEKNKLQQDRLIRAQQEQEYFQNLQQPEVQSPQDTLQKAAVVQQQRAALRSQLCNYDPQSIKEGIQFRIRFPNGCTIHLTLPRTEQIQYLFRFIESHESPNLGFENEPRRHFDILQPRQKLYLSGRKEQIIGEVFEDSAMETLMVKQL